MNTKRVVALTGMMVFFIIFSSFKSVIKSKKDVDLAQEGLIVYATYDGHEDYGYNFITKDKAGDERTLTFQKVEASVLKIFDLNSETFVGTKFKVIFNRTVKITKDADNMDDEEEINTITLLEKL